MTLVKTAEDVAGEEYEAALEEAKGELEALIEDAEALAAADYEGLDLDSDIETLEDALEEAKELTADADLDAVNNAITALEDAIGDFEEAAGQEAAEAMIESITLQDLRTNANSIWSVTINRAKPFKDNVEAVKVRILAGDKVLAENIAKDKVLTSVATGELTSPFSLSGPDETSESWVYSIVLPGIANKVEVELVIDGVAYIVTE